MPKQRDTEQPIAWVEMRRDLAGPRWDIKVHLNGFEDRFVFALRADDVELQADGSLILQDRVEKAKAVLWADWERAGKPNA